MHTIQLHKKVKKFLKNHKEIASIFYKKIQILKDNPISRDVDVKKLSGKPQHYRLRIGKYRFLYEVIDEEVVIYFYEADSRGGIY